MATFRIKSDKVFELKKLNSDEITITKISSKEGISPLFSTISIITKYPNGSEYSRPFNPTWHYSNTKADYSTDLPIYENIKNCEFTQLKINKMQGSDFTLEIEYFPSPKFISTIKLNKLWGKYDLKWKLNSDVNILVGINGSGKTTLLNIVEEVFNRKNSLISKTKSHLLIEFDGDEKIEAKDGVKNSQPIENFKKLSTFDIPVNDKTKVGKETTQLDGILSALINGSGESLSFIKVSDLYREEENTLLRLGKTKESDNLRNKIPDLFALINDFFKDTNKTIQIDASSRNIYFKLDEKAIELKQLSAGEKQLLLILFTVFIQQEKPFILMMDEPEISLHIRWQQKLISTIRALNPNCQLIIATHSPSIFGKGYGDKLFWIEKLWSNNG